MDSPLTREQLDRTLETARETDPNIKEALELIERHDAFRRDILERLPTMTTGELMLALDALGDSMRTLAETAALFRQREAV